MAVKCGCRGIQVIMFLNLITIPFLFHLETTIPKMCRIEGCSFKEVNTCQVYIKSSSLITLNIIHKKLTYIYISRVFLLVYPNKQKLGY